MQFPIIFLCTKECAFMNYILLHFSHLYSATVCKSRNRQSCFQRSGVEMTFRNHYEPDSNEVLPQSSVKMFYFLKIVLMWCRSAFGTFDTKLLLLLLLQTRVVKKQTVRRKKQLKWKRNMKFQRILQKMKNKMQQGTVKSPEVQNSRCFCYICMLQVIGIFLSLVLFFHCVSIRIFSL